MADQPRNMALGCRALLAIGIVGVLATATPSTGNAGVEARRIPLPVGDAVTVVKPAVSGFHAVSYADDGAADAERDARVRVLSALADRLEQGHIAAPEPARSTNQAVVFVPVYFRYCQTGLFGRPINTPCFERPDATLLNRR